MCSGRLLQLLAACLAARLYWNKSGDTRFSVMVALLMCILARSVRSWRPQAVLILFITSKQCGDSATSLTPRSNKHGGQIIASRPEFACKARAELPGRRAGRDSPAGSCRPTGSAELLLPGTARPTQSGSGVHCAVYWAALSE